MYPAHQMTPEKGSSLIAWLLNTMVAQSTVRTYEWEISNWTHSVETNIFISRNGLIIAAMTIWVRKTL